MSNRLLEFHDSVLEGVDESVGQISVRFSAAYVHESEGTPGVDEGKGWYQHATLVLGSAALLTQPSNYPLRISEGTLRLGGKTFDNCLPIPFHEEGNAELDFVFNTGERLTIRGKTAALELSGEAKNVEHFKGSTG